MRSSCDWHSVSAGRHVEGTYGAGRAVVELGCGGGLPALAAALAGAASVLATDVRDPLETARSAVRSSFHSRVQIGLT